jgi:hypothetical protein
MAVALCSVDTGFGSRFQQMMSSIKGLPAVYNSVQTALELLCIIMKATSAQLIAGPPRPETHILETNHH